MRPATSGEICMFVYALESKGVATKDAVTRVSELLGIDRRMVADVVLNDMAKRC